ncbi:MAG TPA: hypothetical protein VFI03_12205 [Solirubrobacterales bacterium]|nr:hypothetical protein [Solirubrobacterales bacterium]
MTGSRHREEASLTNGTGSKAAREDLARTRAAILQRRHPDCRVTVELDGGAMRKPEPTK